MTQKLKKNVICSIAENTWFQLLIKFLGPRKIVSSADHTPEVTICEKIRYISATTALEYQATLFGMKLRFSLLNEILQSIAVQGKCLSFNQEDIAY